MVPDRFFAGELRGWGMEIGVLGGLGRRLQVDASGRFDEATRTLQLDETYLFDDGHADHLRWRIRKLDDARYEALEDRALEPGEGEAAGSAFRLTYRRAVPRADGSSSTVSFDDWFVQIDEETLMVWASLQKLMLPVGSMSVIYRRIAPAAGAPR